MFGRAVRSLAALCAALSVAHAMPASAASDSWTPNADDAVLLEVRSGQYRLGEGVRGYMTPSGPCVDLADTLLALDIPIRLDKQSRRATGWALDESRTIVIDRASNMEHIKNDARPLTATDVRDTPEGWCVAPTVLSRWFGIGIAVDSGNALLTIKSDRKLPAEAAAERRARTGAVRPASFDLASLPHARVVAHGVAPPSVDIVASIGGLRDYRNGSRGDVQYEAFAAGEIGPVAYNARLASDRRGRPASLRVQAYRIDPAATLLGPLRATTVAVGDVVGLSTPLVAQSSAGRGAMLTNRPVERRDRFDKIDLRGELPRGWDAELYRNGQLFGFAQDRADGRYEFLDVPLQYGPNRLEVVLYGPQGQVRREVRQVPVGLDSIPPKKTYYWAGLNDDGHDLIDLAGSGGGSGAYRRGGWRASLGLERGLDVKTSVALALHSLTIDGLGRRNYAEASIRRALGSALIEASGAFDTSGGRAARLSAIGTLGTTRYAAETIWASDFRSDRVDRDVTGLHSLTLDRVFGSGRGGIPVGIQARWTTRSTGNDTIDVAARVSAGLGRLAVTGELVLYDERHAGTTGTRKVDAGLLANTRIGRVRLRGEARFRVVPEARLQSAVLVGEWSAGNDLDARTAWRAELGYDRDLSRARVALGYVRRFDRLALTATAEAASDGSVGAGLSVAFSLGRDPRRSGLRMTAGKLASRGSTAVTVYRDTNANGRRDPDEPGEPAVALTAGLVGGGAPTDSAGRAVIDGLEPYQPMLIGVDASSLPDPLLQPAGPGVVVVPRPGIVAQVEIGLVPTGDIDGTLVRTGGGPLEGVDLELLDATGRTIVQTRSEFDGFFLFERVPYGRYTIRIGKLAADATKLLPELVTEAVVSARTPSVHLGAVAGRARATVALK